ncbi:PEP-CTERM sorting domain-containing protein [Marinobacter sp. M1N3S26]|uniref:PEP-CTERM sorting domain-containing protein n=1 Tax=unclassified Marinobacter TaxID=83889 RepID=UPI00387B9896
MKQYLKPVAAVLAIGVASAANAAPILNISGQGASAASAAEAAFLGSAQSGYITENFDDASYSVGTQAGTINSVAGVGSFSRVTAGSGGLCDTGSYDCDDGLAVLDAATTPFTGRFSVSPDNWLDSMDAMEMTISLTAGYNAIGFYMTDPNDAGGRFSIGGVDFSFTDVFGSSLGNGKVYYVTLFDAAGLDDISIYSNNPDDGYGLDDVTIASVAEPGTLALLALGVFGLGMARRRQKA